MRNLPPIQNTEQVFYENILRYDTVHLKRYKLATEYMDETSTVLDYGSGTSYGSFIMSGEAKHVFAVDQDKKALDYAKEFYYRKNITHLLLNYPPSDWKFDTIVAFEVVEHIEDSDGLIKKFHELLNSDGVLVLSVPNESVVPHATASNHFHHRHYTPQDLDELITSNGFKLEKQYTQIAKSRPEILPGWFGGTLIAVCRKV